MQQKKIDDHNCEDHRQGLEQALENVKPVVEVKSRRVGGATYQVPIEVRPARRQTLAMRWVIDAARKRSEKSMAHRLAHELLDAANAWLRSHPVSGPQIFVVQLVPI